MSSFLSPQAFKLSVALFLFIVFLMPVNLSGNEDKLSKEETVCVSNVIGLSAITAWGVLKWDYFQNSPEFANEGWFSEDTENGGFDKLGHFYFSYTLSHLLSAIYENSGYSSNKAAKLGSLSSFCMSSWMEIGDAFSHFGTSYEDIIMNLIGSAVGYVWYTYPQISEKIDFRLEYRPDFSQSDFSTDYENQRFLMALKLDGFEFAQANYLKYIEFHLGYFIKGYDNRINPERNVYIGIGINLSRIFKEASMPKVSKLFNYVQVPYTYIDAQKDLNE